MVAASLLFLSLAATPIELATSSYKELEYEKCIRHLQQAAKLAASAEEAANVHVLRGMCQLGLGREKAASVQFETALKLNPKVQLLEGAGPRVKSTFEEVRARVAPTEEHSAPTIETAAPPPDVPAVALTPPPEPPAAVDAQIVEAPKKRNIVVPAIIGGAGIAGIGAFAALGVMAKQFESKANAAEFESDALQLGAQARSYALGANIALGVGCALVVGAVLSYLLQ